MTTYSHWQSGKIEPLIDGVYERRRKYWRQEWLAFGDGRFKNGRWLRDFDGSKSRWQTHNGDKWQWRGFLS